MPGTRSVMVIVIVSTLWLVVVLVREGIEDE